MTSDEALNLGSCPCWVHNAALTNDIEALRRIAIWYADWNNKVRLLAMAERDGDIGMVQFIRSCLKT